MHGKYEPVDQSILTYPLRNPLSEHLVRISLVLFSCCMKA